MWVLQMATIFCWPEGSSIELLISDVCLNLSAAAACDKCVQRVSISNILMEHFGKLTKERAREATST